MHHKNINTETYPHCQSKHFFQPCRRVTVQYASYVSFIPPHRNTLFIPVVLRALNHMKKTAYRFGSMLIRKYQNAFLTANFMFLRYYSQINACICMGIDAHNLKKRAGITPSSDITIIKQDIPCFLCQPEYYLPCQD